VIAFVLLSILATIVVLLIIAVSVPLRLRLQAHSEPSPAVRLQGTVRGLPYLTFLDSEKTGGTPGQTADKEEKATRATEQKPDKHSKNQRGVPRGVLRLVRDVLARIRIVGLRASGTFGLADPADTGIAFGLLTPLIYGTRSGTVQFDVRPDFDRACASGTLDAIVEVQLISFVPPAVRFGWRNMRERWA